jgi:hypothetical protein
MMPLTVSDYYKLKRDADEFNKQLEKDLNVFFKPKPVEPKKDDEEIELTTIKKVTK